MIFFAFAACESNKQIVGLDELKSKMEKIQNSEIVKIVGIKHWYGRGYDEIYEETDSFYTEKIKEFQTTYKKIQTKKYELTEGGANYHISFFTKEGEEITIGPNTEQGILLPGNETVAILIRDKKDKETLDLLYQREKEKTEIVEHQHWNGEPLYLP